MTATDDRAAVACPDWCDQHECKGEHWQDPTYPPVSGRKPYVTHELGTVWPTIGVGMDYSVRDGDNEPSVCLHVTGYYGSAGRTVDENVNLRAHEAERLAKEILERVTVIRAMGSRR